MSQSHRFFLQYLPQALQASAVRHPWVTTQEGLHRREYQLHLRAFLKARPYDALGVRLGLDTGLLSLSSQGASIDGRSMHDAVAETGLLGATHAEWQLGTAGFFMVRAGKLRPTLALGALYDAYALGIMVDADLSYLDAPPDIFFTAHLLLADATFTDRLKRSPLLSFEAGWTGRGRTKVALLGAAMFDNDSAVEPLFADAVARDTLLRVASALDERAAGIAQPRLHAQAQQLRDQVVQGLVSRYNEGDRIMQQTTSGVVGWLGVLGQWQHGPLWLQGRALLGLGQISSDVQATAEVQSFLQDRLSRLPDQGQALLDALDTQGQVPVLGYFLSIDAEYEVLPDLSVRTFGVVVSGDDRLSLDSKDTYSAFVSVAPLLPYTSLFFRGAAATRLSSPTTASLAPDGAGILAGGVGLTAWLDELRVRAVVAALGSEVRSAFADGRYYGSEVNLGLSGPLCSFVTLSADFAVFVPGPYFGQGVPVAVQGFGTATAHFPAL